MPVGQAFKQKVRVHFGFYVADSSPEAAELLGVRRTYFLFFPLMIVN